MIDWQSEENTILINPRTPKTEQDILLKAIEASSLKKHFWIATSGSNGRLKWVALSKEAVLASAAAVNRHLHSNEQDIWLNPLPFFHVGGLGILARSFHSEANTVAYINKDQHWNPREFVEQLNDSRATLTSLVPAQLFDIIQENLLPSKNIRAIIIGGGVLNEALYLKAVKMGWPLLPSYGLTECSSQVATAPLDSWKEKKYPLMHPLDHVTIEPNEFDFLKIKSPALLTAYLYSDPFSIQYVDPKVDGWFLSEDKAVIIDGKIQSVSRGDSFIKIGGESCDLVRLEQTFDTLKLSLGISYDAVIIALPDNRLGHTIHLVVTETPPHPSVNGLINSFAEHVKPFERIKMTHFLAVIPRSPLKKLLKTELLRELGNT